MGKNAKLAKAEKLRSEVHRGKGAGGGLSWSLGRGRRGRSDCAGTNVQQGLMADARQAFMVATKSKSATEVRTGPAFRFVLVPNERQDERCEATYQMAWMEEQAGDTQAAFETYGRCMELWSKEKERRARKGGRESRAMRMRGMQATYRMALIAHNMHSLHQAQQLYEQFLSLTTEEQEEEGREEEEEVREYFGAKALAKATGYALCNLAVVKYECGEDEGEGGGVSDTLMEEVLDLYRTAQAADARNVQAGSGVASILMQMGQWEEATAAWRKQLTLEPTGALVHYNLALCQQHVAGHLMASGAVLEAEAMLAEAVDSYGRATTFDGELAVAYCNMAEAMRRLGDVHASLGHYERAIQLYEESSSERREGLGIRLPCRVPVTQTQAGGFYHCYGMCLKQLGRTEEAVAALKQAVRLQEKSCAAHAACAACLLVAAQTDRRDEKTHAKEAVLHYSAALALATPQQEENVRDGLAKAERLLRVLSA